MSSPNRQQGEENLHRCPLSYAISVPPIRAFSCTSLGLIQIGFRPNSLFSAKLTSNDTQGGMVKEPFAVLEIWTHPAQILARIALNHTAHTHSLIRWRLAVGKPAFQIL